MLYLVLIYIFNVRKIQKIVVLILPFFFFFLIVWRATRNQFSGICGAYEEVAVQANFSRFIGFWNFRSLGWANIINVLRAIASSSLDFAYI